MSTKLYTEPKKTSKSVANKNDSLMRPSTSKSTAASSSSSTSNDSKIQDMCIAEGCNNVAVSHSEWDNEYCCVSCCYNHCKNTFRGWLTANKIAKAKINTTTLTQESVAGPSHQSESASVMQ